MSTDPVVQPPSDPYTASYLYAGDAPTAATDPSGANQIWDYVQGYFTDQVGKALFGKAYDAYQTVSSGFAATRDTLIGSAYCGFAYNASLCSYYGGVVRTEAWNAIPFHDLISYAFTADDAYSPSSPQSSTATRPKK